MDDAKDMAKVTPKQGRERRQPQSAPTNSTAQLELALPYAGEDEGPYFQLVEIE